jgi:TolB-like protein/DNA-binding winged helix-turn-helix (wHTH) protein/tetratricopeptide (TPR) repeat protein
MALNPLQDDHLFVFGDFSLDPRQRLLFRGREVVALEPKVFDTLLALVESPGQALSKDDLLSRVWPDVAVEEGSLTRNVSTLRKVLATSDNPQGFIDTLPRHGYRFHSVVQRVTAAPATGATPEVSVQEVAAPVPVVAPRRRWFPIAAGIAALLVAAAAGAAWRWGRSSPTPITSIASIAVLPLQNLSGDPDQEFFSDGMTEAVITRLAQISDARVISRTSVMRFKATSDSVPAIGRQLDVDAVVEGSVQRVGDRVRITVQLIHAATDSHLWAKEFEGTTADVLGLQRRIATAIAADISSKIEPRRFTEGVERTVAPEAYDAFLRGRFLFWKTEPESAQRAVTEFRKAIALEPAFAGAHAGLSLSLAEAESMGVASPTGEAMMAARRAIALDDTLAEAHAALAGAAFDEWDWDTSQREYERALSLFPDSLDACYRYSTLLSALGRHEEAITWSARFAERNPMLPALHVFRAGVLINARRYDEAERLLKFAMELEPRSFLGTIALVELYKLTGRAHQAIPLLSSSPIFANTAFMASAYAAVGRREEALAIVRTVERTSVPDDPLSIAMVYLHLGDDDRGFHWLERAVERRLGAMPFLNVHPAYDRWRKDPRFVALVRQLRLPETIG